MFTLKKSTTLCNTYMVPVPNPEEVDVEPDSSSCRTLRERTTTLPDCGGRIRTITDALRGIISSRPNSIKKKKKKKK